MRAVATPVYERLPPGSPTRTSLMSEPVVPAGTRLVGPRDEARPGLDRRLHAGREEGVDHPLFRAKTIYAIEDVEGFNDDPHRTLPSSDLVRVGLAYRLAFIQNCCAAMGLSVSNHRLAGMIGGRLRAHVRLDRELNCTFGPPRTTSSAHAHSTTAGISWYFSRDLDPAFTASGIRTTRPPGESFRRIV